MPSTSLDTSVPALVLKVGDYVIHHGGLGVTRSLGRAGIPVYGVHEDRLAPAGLSRYTTGRFVWRTAGEGEHQDQMLAGIGTVAERIGCPAVLVPTDDHAAVFVAEHAELLRRWFLIPQQSAEVVRHVTDKAWLLDRCHQLGVPVPATTVVSTADELTAFSEAASFPVVAKRCRPWLRSDGRRAASTRIVGDRRTLLDLQPLRSPLLLQEHIPRDRGEDWLFHAYCDASSECLVAFTGRKIRSFPSGAGETALGHAVGNPTLEQQARELMRALSYTGAVSLDYRFDRRDGTYKLLDFNPRVGAIFRLFETGTGVDVVRALHLDLTGRAVPAGRQVDRVLRVEGYDVGSVWSQVRARDLAWSAVWSSWQSADETAWWAADDPIPALVALGRGTARSAGLRSSGRRTHGPRHLTGRARRPVRAGGVASR